MHQAIEFYEQNLKLARETGDARGEMAALGSLARAYAALDERDKAIECYEQALMTARQTGDARGERQTLKSLNDLNQAPKPAGESEADKSSKPIKSQKPRKKSDSAKPRSARSKALQLKSRKKQPIGKKANDS